MSAPENTTGSPSPTPDWDRLFDPAAGYADLAREGVEVAPLSPLDGRYRSATAPLANDLSEAALNRARVHVEVEWLIHLLDHRVLPGAPALTGADRAYLRRLPVDFDRGDIDRLAVIEARTRHDVKAVEYLLQEHLDAAPTAAPGPDGAPAPGPSTVLPHLHEAVHIFCTSEDVNNLAYALTIKTAVRRVWLPAARALVAQLTDMAHASAGVPMLAHTHGQPATPVTMGKELAVFVHRLSRQLARIGDAEYLGKVNGATGTWAAHVVAVPGADWPAITRDFVESLGLTWNPVTTQIESHDWQAELDSDLARFNRIAHNLATDCWTYISMGYFHQNLSAQGTTGSSTMPHKVNPIRFENAEANLEISCALLDSLASTLVTSRMQRDLTDSTTQRNLGVALGHSLLALDNLRGGLAGLDVDQARLADDLEANWAVLGEAVQQAMRAASLAGATGMANPYERLKELTRGHTVTAGDMRSFIAGLGLPADVEARLLALTPSTYIGLSERIAGWV
ncbi:adenylosuccinate lyase [Schaalia naturae]|jgi:adenylosuccinate lyase|uniref:Adenylosuccinate lyase n=1 Tax=Schaalia naturae TaxID=635203 RepID=A0ABW2SML8_9ACTO